VQHAPRVGEERLAPDGGGAGEIDPARVPIEPHHPSLSRRRRPAQLYRVARQPGHLRAHLASERPRLHRPAPRVARGGLVEWRPVALALVGGLRAHLVALVRKVDDHRAPYLPDHAPKVTKRLLLGAHRGDEVGHARSQVVDRRGVNIGHSLQLELRIHVWAHLASESVELVHNRWLVRAAVTQRIVLGRLAQLLPMLQLLLDELAQRLGLLRQALGLHAEGRQTSRRQTRTSTYARRVRRCSNTWATTTTTTTGL